MIPNLVFSITCKDGFENLYQNKPVEILEQIGRFGCFISMFLMIPFLNKGFWFENGKIIYIIFGIVLAALYCIGWMIFWKKDSVRKSLCLSIVPSLLFIESAVVCGNLQLLVFAVVFAPCHILISYMNAMIKLSKGNS